MSTIIGLDPSLASTGIASDTETYTVTTKADDPTRLAKIYNAVYCQLTTGRPTLAIIEDLPKHAQGAGLTGMAQGVIRLACLDADVPYVLVTAASLKKYATGNGSASKADMRMAWYQRTGEDIRDDNQVDAAWLRQIGLALTGDPRAIKLPKTHTIALEKVQLP